MGSIHNFNTFFYTIIKYFLALHEQHQLHGECVSMSLFAE